MDRRVSHVIEQIKLQELPPPPANRTPRRRNTPSLTN
jgi:hypothetical protein